MRIGSNLKYSNISPQGIGNWFPLRQKNVFDQKATVSSVDTFNGICMTRNPMTLNDICCVGNLYNYRAYSPPRDWSLGIMGDKLRALLKPQNITPTLYRGV